MKRFCYYIMWLTSFPLIVGCASNDVLRQHEFDTRREQSLCSPPSSGCGYGLWNINSCECNCIPVSLGVTYTPLHTLLMTKNPSHFFHILVTMIICFQHHILPYCSPTALMICFSSASR